jgi:hypothetical protein
MTVGGFRLGGRIQVLARAGCKPLGIRLPAIAECRKRRRSANL